MCDVVIMYYRSRMGFYMYCVCLLSRMFVYMFTCLCAYGVWTDVSRILYMECILSRCVITDVIYLCFNRFLMIEALFLHMIEIDSRMKIGKNMN